MHGIVYAKGAKFVQSAKNIPVLLFGYFPVEILISNRFQRFMSQMKENRFLIKFIIYYFLVEFLPGEL